MLLADQVEDVEALQTAIAAIARRDPGPSVPGGLASDDGQSAGWRARAAIRRARASVSPSGWAAGGRQSVED